MRLIEGLAARRRYYGRPLPTLPDILLIDIPRTYAGSSLALGRYYPIILETLAELGEFETFLCAERDQLIPPNLLDHRPSSLQAHDIIFARYAPASPDWPWLLLCRWPSAYVAMVPDPAEDFARGAYTIEAFAHATEMDEAEQRLLAALGPHEARHVRSVTAGPVGNA